MSDFKVCNVCEYPGTLSKSTIRPIALNFNKIYYKIFLIATDTVS